MKPPPVKTRLLGHPIVVLPATLLALFVFYQWSQDAGQWPPALMMLVVLGVVLKANEQVTQYKAWKRAWDGMAATPAPWKGARRGMQRFAAVTTIVLILWYLLATIDQPGHALAAALVSIWLMLAALYGLLQIMRGVRSTGVRRTRPPAPVALAIDRPVLPVPNLQAAYEALPDHCWRVLNAPAEAS